MSTAKRDIVLDVVAKISGVDRAKLAPSMDLSGELAIDSPKALQILMELEERLQIEISDEDAAKMETLGDILAHVEAGETTKS